MNFIRAEREKLGLTQQAVAEITGLSVRTIQRAESSNAAPTGYTLVKLAELFKTTPAVLSENFTPLSKVDRKDRIALKFLNLSVLAFFIFPFGNIFIPIFLWYRGRKSKLVDEVGRKIINFQILWTVLMCTSLCIAPFIDENLPIPLIFIALGLAWVINFAVIITCAYMIEKEKFNFLDLRIRLI